MIDPESRDKSECYLDLGKLKGNIRNQNYQLLPNTDVTGYVSLLRSQVVKFSSCFRDYLTRSIPLHVLTLGER